MTKEKKAKTDKSKAEEKKKKWLSKEGELVVDVFKTKENIIIQTAIAGIKKDDLEIITEKDTVKIKGERKRPETGTPEEFYTKECFWGPFSREIVFPEETNPAKTKATMNQGVLTIKIPRIEKEVKKKVELDD